MSKKTIFTTTLLSTFLLTACATNKSAMQQENLNLLQNKNWVLTHIGATAYPADPSNPNSPSLQFDSATQRVSGADGCNRLMGTYAIKNYQIQLGQLAGTQMFCQNTAELSSKYNEALNKVAGYQVVGKTLKLLDRHGNPVLQFSTN